MVDIQYGATIMGGREISRPYHAKSFREIDCTILILVDRFGCYP